MLGRLRALIAEDNAEWRDIITDFVGSECDVVGNAERGDEIVPLALQLQPDLVTLDISMPGQSGLKAFPSLRAALPDAILIVISTIDNRLYRDEASRLGADYYVPKRSVISDLIPAIRRGRLSTQRNLRLA